MSTRIQVLMLFRGVPSVLDIPVACASKVFPELDAFIPLNCTAKVGVIRDISLDLNGRELIEMTETDVPITLVERTSQYNPENPYPDKNSENNFSKINK